MTSTSSFSHPRDEDGHHHVAMKRKPSTDIHPGSTASGLVSSKKAKLVKAESESPRKVGIAFEPPASVPPLADEKSSVSDEPGSSGSPPITSTSSRSKPRVKVPPSKVRTGTLQLKEEDVDRYLHGFSPIPISSPLSLEISLELLNKNYGSITQGLLWEKGPYKFLFPGYDTNPLMPTSPGEPGLLLSARTEVVRDTWTLFIKILNNSKARWNYAGEYRGAVVGSLGAKGFSEQPEKVKRTWGTKIAHHKKFEPYLRMRARITLRKLGKALSELNIQRELEEIKKRPKTSSKISSDDVIEAFESGHEVSAYLVETTNKALMFPVSFAQDLSSLASTAPAAGRGNAAVGGGSGTHQTIIRSGSSLKKGKQKAMSGNQTPSSQPEGSDSEGSD
ncbi:hypothetical protein CC2G_008501 [Coprinopsis cinerea AmutBmut pab1-1]|nr:hypothetical protein CC2G_008501 [Coprinopsis cinerea AmutBmut pab1-1]